jgi:four helix bundle protein
LARLVLSLAGMGIRRHEDILAWQLGLELSQRLAEILSRSAARRDRNYCSEVQEAADAISANIAEGFDRYRLPGFRYFLEIANGSLGETFTRLRQGFARGMFTEHEFNELMILCTRTRKLLAPLITSVEAQSNLSRQNRKPRPRPQPGRKDPAS